MQWSYYANYWFGTPNNAAGKRKMAKVLTIDEILCRKAQARLNSSLL
jgi:hypothetical protein